MANSYSIKITIAARDDRNISFKCIHEKKKWAHVKNYVCY